MCLVPLTELCEGVNVTLGEVLSRVKILVYVVLEWLPCYAEIAGLMHCELGGVLRVHTYVCAYICT